MKIKFISAFLALILICGLFGCSSEKKEKEYPINVNGVNIDKEPKRVVVLSDSIADIILACSMEIKLVGRSSECTQSTLSVLPDIGTGSNPDLEKIKSLSPDLVLHNQDLSNENKEFFSSNNISFISLSDATNRTDFVELYSNIGAILNGNITGKEKATKAAQDILLKIDDLSRTCKVDGSQYITACYLYDENGKIASEDTFAGKLIEFAGANNIATNAKESFMNIDEIILSNPNIIFCDTGVEAKLRADEKFWGLTAINEHKIFEIEKSSMQRQGKTILNTVKFMIDKINLSVNG